MPAVAATAVGIGGRLLKAAALVVICATAIGDAAAAPGHVPPPADAVPPAIYTPSSTQELHTALELARPGDLIVLRNGVVYMGPFRLRRKEGDGWIEIRGQRGWAFPDRGTRIGPGSFRALPKLEAKSRSVIIADPGAHHYRLSGLEISPSPGTFLFNVIELGSDANALDQVPHDIEIERSYIHGDPVKGSRRGVALNGARIAITDSYFSDFKEVGADSQAICGWNGPGPFRIENNYLEAAGENIMFGGAAPGIDGLVPSDIEVRRNHFRKPLQWRADHPQFAGTAWTVKNLFELKNARRVVVRDNFFEHNWVQAQSGMAILFTPRSEDGRAPWATVEEITFENNVVRRVAGAINILGRDDVTPSQLTRGITIRNNLFLEVGESWGDGRLLVLVGGAADVRVEHNTALQSGSIVVVEGEPHPGFVFENNIALHNEFGIFGGGVGSGSPAVDRYFPGGVVRGNVLVGADERVYPGGNFFPGRLADVGLIGTRGPDTMLSASSRFRGKGTDGRDPGVRIADLRLAFVAGPR
jgi:hypothetical protein